MELIFVNPLHRVMPSVKPLTLHCSFDIVTIPQGTAPNAETSEVTRRKVWATEGMSPTKLYEEL